MDQHLAPRVPWWVEEESPLTGERKPRADVADQEEVFVPLRGTLTLLLEDPPQRIDVEPGGLVAVHPGTAMQARNETDEEILFFAYGSPPVHGNATFIE